MGNGAAQPIRNLLVTILRIPRLRDGKAAEFFHFFDDVERVARVLRVLQDDGGGKAERPLPASGDGRAGLLRPGKSEKLHRQVFGFRERGLGEADPPPLPQSWMTVLPG